MLPRTSLAPQGPRNGGFQHGPSMLVGGDEIVTSYWFRVKEPVGCQTTLGLLIGRGLLGL